MKNRKVRFAVLGCGRIASAHLDGIRNAADAELAAVCDIIEERAAAAAHENGLAKWYVSLEKMLAEEAIDVVNICTPSGLHCDLAMVAAKAGKHILCEKPLDISRKKVDMLIETCRASGVILGSIFQRRTNSAAINARNAISSGKLGKVVLGSASLKYYRDQDYYESGEWRGTWALDGGGALMNQGIHGVDMLQWLVGDVESVFARCSTLIRDIEVEDTAVVSVKFKSGALGVIECATSVYPGQDTIFSIHGEKGTIILGDKGFYQWDISGSDEQPPEAGDGFGGINCGWTDNNMGHTKQIQDMAEAVLYKRQPLVTGEDARKAVDLILAIYESSQKGVEVYL